MIYRPYAARVLPLEARVERLITFVLELITILFVVWLLWFSFFTEAGHQFWEPFVDSMNKMMDCPDWVKHQSGGCGMWF